MNGITGRSGASNLPLSMEITKAAQLLPSICRHSYEKNGILAKRILSEFRV